MNVHEPFADGRQRVERCGRAVDELAIRAAGGECALEDKLIVFTCLKAVFFEKRSKRRAEFGNIEDGFDRTTIARRCE